MTETLYRLQMHAGPRAGQTVPLNGTRLTIGRYPLAEIVLDDPQVAYRHAVLTRAGDEWRLSDLNSETGTMVNGRRVGPESVVLRPGDLIVLGSGVAMTFETEAPVVEGLPPVGEPSAGADGPPAEEEQTARTGDVAADEYPAATKDEELAVRPSEAQAAPPPVVAEHAPPGGRGATVYAAPAPSRRRNNRLWWTAAGCLALLFICCCVFSFFMYFWGGDWLLRQLGYLP